MRVICVEQNAGSIRRVYELHRDIERMDETDKTAVLRWLFDVIPAKEERYRTGPASIFIDSWDLG